MSYTLSILTPQGEVFKGAVNFVLAAGETGEVGVLGNHAAMIVALKRGIMKATTQDGTKFIVHDTGVLEVKPSHDVLALVEGAQIASDEKDAAAKSKGQVS